VFGDGFGGGVPTTPFQVGHWLVEPAIGRVSRDNKEAHLEPKVMQVLVCLAERAGELVPKSEITDAVWQVGGCGSPESPRRRSHQSPIR